MTAEAKTSSEDAGALAALERFVVDNDELLALESLIGRFNIFDVLKIARAEIRHSNFLAFLLDPAESHGQGDLFLKAILMDLLKVAPPNLRPPIALDGTDLRGVEVAREEHDIDVLITCQDPPFAVAIENKVDAREHSNQLRRYKERVRLHYPGLPPLFVYLTPDADEPSDSDWIPYSYKSIHGVLSRVLQTYRNSIGKDVLVFLEHYRDLIGTLFMNDPEIDKLCQRIYKNHRQALELIIERGKPASGVLAEVARVLREDTRWHVFNQTDKYARFVPKAWLAWLPPLGLKMDDLRSWIVLRLYLQKKMLDFCVQIRPMKDRTKREGLVKLLITELPKLGFKKSQGG
jgi:hypothetical protein